MGSDSIYHSALTKMEVWVTNRAVFGGVEWVRVNGAGMESDLIYDGEY